MTLGVSRLLPPSVPRGRGFFISGERLVAFLGQSGLDVVTRMMGLILAVIGVQMVIEGVSGAIKMAR